jgi:hypothetical protein
MATMSTVPWHNSHEHSNTATATAVAVAAAVVRSVGNQQSEKSSVMALSSGSTCPPSSFPDKFQDFFTVLNEDIDDLPSMLEDKLIPRWDIAISFHCLMRSTPLLIIHPGLGLSITFYYDITQLNRNLYLFSWFISDHRAIAIIINLFFHSFRISL